MTIQNLASAFSFLDEKALSLLDSYIKLVIKANEMTNLTAIDDYDSAVEKHLYDCLLPLKYISLEGKKVLDIGSGAGFPGLVFAIAYSTASLTLVESNGKKASFLESAISELGLENAVVAKARAEDLKERGAYDVSTCRAVGSLPMTMELSAPFLKIGGTFIAMRGKAGKEEMEGAKAAAKTLGFDKPDVYFDELPGDHSERINAFYKKVSPTPKKYPRPFADIKRNPL